MPLNCDYALSSALTWEDCGMPSCGSSWDVFGMDAVCLKPRKRGPGLGEVMGSRTFEKCLALEDRIWAMMEPNELRDST